MGLGPILAAALKGVQFCFGFGLRKPDCSRTAARKQDAAQLFKIRLKSDYSER